MRKKGKGWRGEPVRHGLASKGIETKAKGLVPEGEEVMRFYKSGLEGAKNIKTLELLSLNNNDIPYQDEDRNTKKWLHECLKVAEKWMNDKKLTEDEEQKLLLTVDPFTAKLSKMSRQVVTGGFSDLFHNGYLDQTSRIYVLDDAMKMINEYCTNEKMKEKTINILVDVKSIIDDEFPKFKYDGDGLSEHAYEQLDELSEQWRATVYDQNEDLLLDVVADERLQDKEIIYDGGWR